MLKFEVQLYDENAEILKILGEDYFELNEEIVGEKSGTVARIDDINLTIFTTKLILLQLLLKDSMIIMDS